MEEIEECNQATCFVMEQKITAYEDCPDGDTLHDSGTIQERSPGDLEIGQAEHYNNSKGGDDDDGDVKKDITKETCETPQVICVPEEHPQKQLHSKLFLLTRSESPGHGPVHGPRSGPRQTLDPRLGHGSRPGSRQTLGPGPRQTFGPDSRSGSGQTFWHSSRSGSGQALRQGHRSGSGQTFWHSSRSGSGQAFRHGPRSVSGQAFEHGSRSGSAPGSWHDWRRSRSSGPLSVSHRRIQSVISFTRFRSAQCSSDPLAIEKTKRPLSENEVFALEYMMDREAHRLGMLERVYETQNSKFLLLSQKNSAKESAALTRFVAIEKEKEEKIAARRQKEKKRTESAQRKRQEIYENKMKEYEKSLREKEKRATLYDPYMLFTSRIISFHTREKQSI